MKKRLLTSQVTDTPTESRASTVGGIVLAVGIAEMLVIAFIILISFMGTGSFSAERDETQPRLLAYAATPDQADVFGTLLTDEHELNDAWMGMSAMTIDGEAVGYVSDAVMGPDGNVKMIVITPKDGSALRDAKILDARFAILTAEAVVIDMAFQTLTAQISADAYFAPVD